MIEEAIKYARKGWPVFPVARNKRPLTARGFLDATTDQDQIRTWWSEHPDAGIAWAPSPGWLVLDIDARHRGHESLDALEREHGRLPHTLTQITGGGGLHLIYRIPTGVEVRQLAGLREGIDTRVGGRGYIVVPPTIHASGLPYAWSRRMPPAEPPAWLIELIRVPAVRTPAPYVPSSSQASTGRRVRYAMAVLAGEARAVAETATGARNDRLNKAWWRLAQFRDVLDRAQVERELTQAGIACGLPESEIAQVLR